MNISLRWLNTYLDKPVTPDEAEHLLTHAGFPIEETQTLPSGDVMLDVEVTSNRGDCLSHIGVAREIAATSDRSLVKPATETPATDGKISDVFSLENRTPDLCPLFTARVIRGVKVGPSPEWLVHALEAVGQRSINALVDITNFINFEFGNPCHVFDLSKLAGSQLVVRFAADGEKLTTLDDKTHALKATDLVVTDRDRPQSLGGIMGGADSEVDSSTTDVVFEMATWDPLTIRTTARRLGIRTDASHRFERIVDPRTIEAAADRAVDLIVKLCGGQPCQGIASEGAPLPTPRVVSMRPNRCNAILGIEVPVARMIELLGTLEVGVEQVDEATLRCTIPEFRPDLTREIDLIEEIARTHGFDHIPLQDLLRVRAPQPDARESAMSELAGTLTGLGYFETVTFSFVSHDHAAPFLPPDLKTIQVSDDRRKAEPVLRPSPLASLLSCRRANQDAGVSPEGGVRLYEVSAVFGETTQGKSVEHRNLALLADTPAPGKAGSIDHLQTGLRLVRGTIEQLVRRLGGRFADLKIAPADVSTPAFDADGHASVAIGDELLGHIGLLSAETLSAYDLDRPVVAAELNVDRLLALYPPAGGVDALPVFPAIERDVSLVLAEDVAWGDVAGLIEGCQLDGLDGYAFVATYRGKQIGAGRKSVTARLRFRDQARTLRHEEVDPQMDEFISACRDRLGADVRS